MKGQLIVIITVFLIFNFAEGANFKKAAKPLLQRFRKQVTDLANMNECNLYADWLLNCVYTSDNISKCGNDFATFVIKNISTTAQSRVIKAGTPYLLIVGGDAESNIEVLKDELYNAIKEPLWDPLRKMVSQYKTYQKFRVPAIKKANKIITKNFICDATAKVKEGMIKNWSSAKKYFYTENKIALCIGSCNA